METQRSRILATARQLTGTPYLNGAGVPAGTARPRVIDCSAFVRWVTEKIFGSDARLSPGENWPSAYTMFQKLKATTAPKAGDLALYSREDRTGLEVWHVMFVTEKGGALGASDEAGKVYEYSKVDYSKRWTFREYREFPLTAETLAAR